MKTLDEMVKRASWPHTNASDVVARDVLMKALAPAEPESEHALQPKPFDPTDPIHVAARALQSAEYRHTMACLDGRPGRNLVLAEIHRARVAVITAVHEALYAAGVPAPHE